MRKVLVSLVGLVAVSALLSACNANLSADAARVDGVAITQARLESTLAAISGDTEYRCVLSAASGGQIKAGAGQGTYASSFAASILTTLVEEQALRKTLAAKHLTISPFARTVAASALQAQFAPPQGSACSASGATVFQGLPADYRSFLVDLQAEQATLLAEKAGVPLTKAGMAAYAKAHPSEATLQCLSAIEVASKAEAVSLTSQVRAGASFSALAKKHSLDAASAASGGALGCVLPSQLTSPLNTAVAGLRPGEVSAPISFGPDFVIFQLTSTSAASADQVANLVLQSQAAKDNAIVVAALSGVSVRVDPAYGHWSKTSGVWQVVPPKGPPAGLLEHPAAVAPKAASPTSPLG